MSETPVITEEFKDSLIGKIPKDWDVVELVEEINIVHGYAFKGEYFSETPPGEVLLVPGNFHREGGLYFDQNNTKYYQGAVPENTVLSNGDLLIVMTDLSPRTLILGRVVQLRLPFKVLHNQRIGKIVLRLPDSWNKRFLMLVMNSNRVRQNIISTSSGTTVRHTSPGRITANMIPKPGLYDQDGITEILDAIDKAIALTDTHITKLKKAKAGLLHDLLTRGIDEHGELRDYTRNPELFKRSLLGIIPKYWEITTLGSVVEHSGGFIQTGPFGSQLHAYEYVDLGVPVIMPQDIVNGQISTEQIGYIAPEKAQILKRHIVQINDVIFARRGELNRCAAIGEREVNWFCGTGCMLARIPKHEINGFWLTEIYRHQYSQKQILAKAVGSTMINLNSTLLKSLVIAKPNIKEQLAIVEKAAIQDKRICVREEYLKKLKLLKKGLMSDLLTGRVRVKI